MNAKLGWQFQGMAPRRTKISAACLVALIAVSGAGAAHAQSAEYRITRFSGPDETHHSYFINGLASAIPAVGYGLRNLSRNLRGRHYSYVTPVESTLPVPAMVVADIRKRVKQNPQAKINLVGVSYGGNIATVIAQQLNLYRIKVNYLAVLDAPAPVPVYKNVHRVDNFFCRRIGCIGQRVTLAWGNKETIKQEFRVRTGHIELSAAPIVEERITGQLSEVAMDVTTPAAPETLLGYDSPLKQY